MPTCFTALPRAVRCAIQCIVALLSLALAGCEKSEPEPYATSTEPAALMRVVFADWSEKRPAEVEVEEGDISVLETMLVSPEAVVQLTPQAVVLVVSGSPTDESGTDMASHGTPGNLGAYWFQQREGRWYLSRSKGSFHKTGSHGNAGTVTTALLDKDTHALIVESGGCWQGYCGSWLDIFQVGADSMKRLLRDDAGIALWANSSGALENCSEALDDKGVLVPASATGPGDCFDIEGKWSLKARKGYADLVLTFSGSVVDETTITPAPAPETSSPAAEASTPDAEPEEWVTVRSRPVKETAVYRFANGTYNLVRGKNPIPGF
ncbi:hypothetical protein [Viridibacterium curvum]|uniref:Lipoprotein n=1 Tax=Viridibacterium curvum TaxID=1101404 RepID=A0ABP9R8F6_9RHOO